MTTRVSLVALLALAAPAAADAPPIGFTPLFNGKDLTGWHGWAIHAKNVSPYDLDKATPEERAKLVGVWTEDARKHWSVENGELVNDGQGAYLATDKEYGDVELLIDYRTVPKADSGIYLRATPQIQIWDSTEQAKFKIGADKGSGGLWNNSPGGSGKDPLVLADNPFGEWNRFRIIQIGERTTVYLNGKLVVDHARMENFWNRKLPLRRTGPVLLQTHGGEIRWRNVFVREIPADEANRTLLERGTGFQPVFNGKDFTGWAGATANYEVADGAIVCKPGKGGVLHTAEEFGDFTARFEYRLPPGGNNGVAVRYPGKGDTAYTGMCEVQLLDDGAAKYANLDVRQFNGSAYGMVAANRGYLRPAGEWNYMEVTALGPAVRVELNGTRILDADLSKVTEFMGGKPHPGKDRTAGFFGFAGHSDPVAFRSVGVKRLAAKE